MPILVPAVPETTVVVSVLDVVPPTLGRPWACMNNEELKSTNPHRNSILIAGLLLCELDKLCRVIPEPSPGPAARPAPAPTARRSAPCAPLPSTVRGRGRLRLRARAQSSV